MPRNRVAAASSTGRPERPRSLQPLRGVDVGVGDLAAGVHPGIRAPRHHQPDRSRAAQDGRERVAEQALDGASARLGGPAGEPGPVVGQVDPDPQGHRASCSALARLPPRGGPGVPGTPVDHVRTRHESGVAAAPRCPAPPPWRGDHRDHPGRPPADPALRRGRRLLRPGPALHLADPATAPDQVALRPLRARAVRADAAARAARGRRVGGRRGARPAPGQRVRGAVGAGARDGRHPADRARPVRRRQPCRCSWPGWPSTGWGWARTTPPRTCRPWPSSTPWGGR